MVDTASLTLFLIAAFVILITPGPAVLYIILTEFERLRL